jgi:predicted transcriptional regulator
VNLTDKQHSVLTTVVKGNLDGSFVDLDQLIEQVDYKTTKEAIQFVIRSLIKKGLMEKKTTEKRRGRRRAVLGATPEGYAFLSRRRISHNEELMDIMVNG